MFGSDANVPAAGANGPSFSGLGFSRPGRVPVGKGVYEVVRMGTNRNALNQEKFYVVVKCVSHDTPAHVGGSFSREISLQGVMLARSYTEIGRLIMSAFGPEAKNLPDDKVAALLNAELLSDGWKKFNETQTIAGQSVVGRKLEIRVVPGSFKKDEQGNEIRGINPKTRKPYDEPLPSFYYDVA